MEAVLDRSLALAWALPDEASSRADRWLARVSPDDVLLVPALWWYEMTNALTVAQRRRRLTGTEVTRLIDLYGALPIQTDTFLGREASWRLHALAQEFGLSAYDAAYLELAQRRGVALATMDRRLAVAARRAGVQITRV
jgi:predicted nucleic acid-binding protein